MPEPLVVCVFGEAGSGKSDLAKHLAENLNFIEVKGWGIRRAPRISLAPVFGFTRPIKDYVAQTFGLVKGDRGWRRKMHRAARSLPPGEYTTSTPLRAFNGCPPAVWHSLAEECWLQRWEREVAARFPDARYVLADDARTEYEFAEAKRRGWVTVLVTGRRRYPFWHPHHWLPTERSVRLLARRHRKALNSLVIDCARYTGKRGPGAVFDWEMKNTGGLDRLRAEARRLADWLQEKEPLTPALSHRERENDKEEA
jgi:hypothetical protein